MIIYAGAISTRNLFSVMLNDMDLVGNAVEIGTHRADFTSVFLKRWKGKHIYCVDPWSTPPGYEEQSKMLWESENREEDYKYVKKSLYAFPSDKYSLIRSTSEEAVKQFSNNSIDFVYIDGDHRYEMVKKDLEIWIDKVKHNGIISGHDIVMPNEINGGWGPGIQRAIKDVFKEEYPVYIVPEENGLPWSFYIIKR